MILMSIKSFFLLLTVFVYMMYRRRMIASGHQPTLIERLIVFLCNCSVFNVYLNYTIGH